MGRGLGVGYWCGTRFSSLQPSYILLPFIFQDGTWDSDKRSQGFTDESFGQRHEDNINVLQAQKKKQHSEGGVKEV